MKRTKIEWLKAKIAFSVMIISVLLADTEHCIIPMTIAVLALLYMKIVADRLAKRGEC